MAKLSYLLSFSRKGLCVLLIYSLLLSFVPVYAGNGNNGNNDNNNTLNVSDDFNSNNISSSLWNATKGTWKQASNLIYAEEDTWNFWSRDKFLELKRNISGYKDYTLSVDITNPPSNKMGYEYSNEYADGGIIIGNNSRNNYVIYLDTHTKTLKMYKYDRNTIWDIIASFFGVIDEPNNLVFSKTVNSLQRYGSYQVELSVQHNDNTNNYDGTIKISDSSNNVLHTQDLNDIDLHFNKLYLYSKYSRWSAFDNFNFVASTGENGVPTPKDFQAYQNGVSIDFQWSTIEHSSDISQIELVYSDEEITANSNVTVISSNINKHDTSYTELISEIIGNQNNIYGKELYFAIRFRKGQAYSDYVTDNVFLLTKPQSPIYAEYDDRIEITWEPSLGAYKYIVKSGNTTLGEALESKYIISKPVSSNIDLTKINVVATRDGNYSEPSNYATKVDVKKVNDLITIQNGTSYVLNWSPISGAIGYEVYSGYNTNSLVKVADTTVNSYTFDILRDGNLIDEFGSQRYFAIKPIMGDGVLTELSNVTSVVFLNRPIIVDPLPSKVLNNLPVTIDDILEFNVIIDKANVNADLIVELGSMLNLESTDLGTVEHIGDNTYRITLSNTNTVNGKLIISPSMNNSSENITSSVEMYLEGYISNGNVKVITNITEKTTQNIIIKSVSNILSGDFGVVDRANQDNVLVSDEPIDVYFGETVSMKSSFTISGESLYDPVIKYSFKNNNLFKFTFPEPVIKYKAENSSTFTKLDYTADFIINGDLLTIIVKPITENNVLNPGEIEIDINSDIVPKDVNDLKSHIQSPNYYMRNLPYEIESKLPNILERSLETKMQILWNSIEKQVVNDERDYQTGEKRIDLELKDIPTIPNVF